MYKCLVCGKVHEFDEINGIEPNVMEYRGAYSCEEHFEEMIEIRDRQRNQIISEEHNKTKVFEGLDVTNSVIGKANQELLKRHIEIASKESVRLKEYEGR